ncbi:MAG: hypothetical protein F4X84_03310 [Synechococcus sp. SB0662_bin_45]|nr:hypothetical protein [Synechococcus sp. SB0668_bin_13]MYE21405.1 hypothetical protein [Synechococcus sp. SB0662_bin_45]MYK86783.1 hypothetical protein [Synechococcus sp. SB0669_bin_7]
MSRYGIGEWYGRPLMSLTPAERRAYATIAMGEAAAPACPFRPMVCNKRGGVCSIQPYREAEQRISGVAGEPVIVCPTRFEQNKMLVQWLADIVRFQLDDVMLAREVPFMRSTTTGKSAGKIDLVIASERQGLRWFGLEVQAVYFSGAGMEAEFMALRQDRHDQPPYPLHNRRPDWRSSSAKRLMPQLRIKGPTLRRWHSKIAVAVDRPFFASIGGPSAQPSQDLDAGDVVWLVPELRDGQLVRDHWEVQTLESSSERLLAADAVTRVDFERVLLQKLQLLQGE